MRRKRLFRALALVTALLVSAGAVIGLLALIKKKAPAYEIGPGDWPMEGKDPAHSAYLEAGPQEALREAWSQRVQQDVTAPPAVAGGRLYAGGKGGMLYCLNAGNGEPLWGFDAGSEIVSTPCVTDEGIYFGTGRGIVFALDGKGGEVWRRELGDAVVASPVVKEEKVYVGSRDRSLYCLQADTGQTLWEYDAGEMIEQSPCVGDGHVFCLSLDWRIHALKEETGELDWQSKLNNIFIAPPVVDEGVGEARVFAVTKTGFFCLDTQTGQEVWKEEITDTRYLSNAALRGNQVLVVLGSAKENSSSAEATNIVTGDTVWASRMKYSEATRLITTQQGAYSADSEGIHFFPFGAEGLAVRQELRGVVPATLTVTSDAVYVATENFKIYCFRQE